MSHFHMSYEDVLNSPMQRLIMLANAIPKYESSKENNKKDENKRPNILDFAKEHNLLKKK